MSELEPGPFAGESKLHPKGTLLDAVAASAWLEAIVDSAEDAIISKDLNGYVRSWNASAERMFGYTADEMVGQHVTKLFPEHLRPQEKQILARIGRGERVEHFETQRMRKNGEI